MFTPVFNLSALSVLTAGSLILFFFGATSLWWPVTFAALLVGTFLYYVYQEAKNVPDVTDDDY